MTAFLLASEFVPRRSPMDGRVDRRSVLLALGELLRSEVDLDILLRRVVDRTALPVAERRTGRQPPRPLPERGKNNPGR